MKNDWGKPVGRKKKAPKSSKPREGLAGRTGAASLVSFVSLYRFELSLYECALLIFAFFALSPLLHVCPQCLPPRLGCVLVPAV